MHPRAGSEERRVRRNNVIPEGLDGTRRGRGFLEVGEVTVIDRPQESFGHRRWAAEVDEVRSLGEREEVVPPSERGEEFDPEIQQVEAVEVVLVAEESESVESILLEAGANRHVKVAEDPADGRGAARSRGPIRSQPCRIRSSAAQMAFASSPRNLYARPHVNSATLDSIGSEASRLASLPRKVV